MAQMMRHECFGRCDEVFNFQTKKPHEDFNYCYICERVYSSDSKLV